MKKISLLLAFCWVVHWLPAQMGITTSIQLMENTRWDRLIRGGYNLPKTIFFKPTIYLGIDFRLPFPKKGIRLAPELSLSKYEFDIDYEVNISPIDQPPVIFPNNDHFRCNFYSFALNSDFYFLSFAKSISKENLSTLKESLTKRIFFRLAPTINYIRCHFQPSRFEPFSPLRMVRLSSNGFNFSFRIGLGIDLKVNDYLTITPIFSYTFLNQLNWTYLGIKHNRINVNKFFPSDTFQSDAHQYQLGIRLGFRSGKLRKHLEKNFI